MSDLDAVPENIRGAYVTTVAATPITHFSGPSWLERRRTATLADAINAACGSFAEFQAQFEAAGATCFGSGWAWLVANAAGSVEVTSTPNQDTPLMVASNRSSAATSGNTPTT